MKPIIWTVGGGIFGAVVGFGFGGVGGSIAGAFFVGVFFLYQAYSSTREAGGVSAYLYVIAFILIILIISLWNVR